MRIDAMAKDITEQVALRELPETVDVKVIFEQIILVTSKKAGPEDVQYLQINLQKLPKDRTVSQECSEHLVPSDIENSEIHFRLDKEQVEFELQLRKDLEMDWSQFEVELEIMKKGERKLIGNFDIRLCDVEMAAVKKTKWRKVLTQNKTFQTLEIKYRVFPESKAPFSHKIPEENGNLTKVAEFNTSKVDSNPFSTDKTDSKTEPNYDINQITKLHPNFRPRSCIVVVGTTGRGKTTTMNLFTGNKATTGGASHRTTSSTQIYRDLHHSVLSPSLPWPAWLDTVGLDEGDAQATNCQLVREYLRALQNSGLEWLHAVVWCISPEDKKLQYLREQAQVIRQFGERVEGGVWGNVIIVAKKGRQEEQSFQGALAAVAEVAVGHQDIVDSVQRLAYSLGPDGIQESEARGRLEMAVANIQEPVRVVWSDEVCRDCGSRGDGRLLGDLCHERPQELERTLLGIKIGKKKVCSCCGEAWSRKLLGHWSYTCGPPCVRVRNPRDSQPGERLAQGKDGHKMERREGRLDRLNCARAID